MNWDEMAGEWNQVKGLVKERWGRLTDDDLAVINGKRDLLVGKLQEKYGLTKEKAEEQIKDWKTPAGKTQLTAKEKAS